MGDFFELALRHSIEFWSKLQLAVNYNSNIIVFIKIILRNKNLFFLVTFLYFRDWERPFNFVMSTGEESNNSVQEALYLIYLLNFDEKHTKRKKLNICFSTEEHLCSGLRWKRISLKLDTLAKSVHQQTTSPTVQCTMYIVHINSD